MKGFSLRCVFHLRGDFAFFHKDVFDVRPLTAPMLTVFGA